MMGNIDFTSDDVPEQLISQSGLAKVVGEQCVSEPKVGRAALLCLRFKQCKCLRDCVIPPAQ